MPGVLWIPDLLRHDRRTAEKLNTVTKNQEMNSHTSTFQFSWKETEGNISF